MTARVDLLDAAEGLEVSAGYLLTLGKLPLAKQNMRHAAALRSRCAQLEAQMERARLLVEKVRTIAHDERHWGIRTLAENAIAALATTPAAPPQKERT